MENKRTILPLEDKKRIRLKGKLLSTDDVYNYLLSKGAKVIYLQLSELLKNSVLDHWCCGININGTLMYTAFTLGQMLFHWKHSENSEMKTPIIVYLGKYIIDGLHRVLREAYLGKKTHIEAYSLTPEDVDGILEASKDKFYESSSDELVYNYTVTNKRPVQ